MHDSCCLRVWTWVVISDFCSHCPTLGVWQGCLTCLVWTNSDSIKRLLSPAFISSCKRWDNSTTDLVSSDWKVGSLSDFFRWCRSEQRVTNKQVKHPCQTPKIEQCEKKVVYHNSRSNRPTTWVVHPLRMLLMLSTRWVNFLVVIHRDLLQLYQPFERKSFQSFLKRLSSPIVRTHSPKTF